MIPEIQSSLFAGLVRVRKIQHDPKVVLQGEGHATHGETKPVAPPAAETATSSDGSRARYQLLGEVGRGGMGAVYKVLDTDLHRTLAMKVALFSGDAAPGSVSAGDPTILERFLEEAQVTGQLDHPGIVPLHEVGIDAEGRVYFTMRLVRGKHFGEIFELAKTGAEGWTEERVLVALVRVCEAMAYAHAKGVVHRDLKPANVMAGRFGEVYVMDWGLAKVRGRAQSPDKSNATVRPGQTIVHTSRVRDGDYMQTSHGTVFGTPVYMAPEQARGEVDRVDAQSDVYSVGAILYHFLAGRPPYVPSGAQVSTAMVLRWVLEGAPEPLRKVAPDVAPELAAICGKAMAREPLARYRDMNELAEDLRAFLAGRPVSALPLGSVGRTLRWCRRNRLAAGLLVAVIVSAAYGIWRLNHLGNEVVRQAALDSTAAETQILKDVNAFYSSAVASRVDRTHVQVTHDYVQKAGAIPIPATFLTDVAEKISEHGTGMRVRQYSDFPFNFRPPWKLDDFERRALVDLRADPDKPVYSFEDVDGRPTLRYAVGRKMEAGCVTCHNTHADSPKTDWKVGDVRGVLEIVRPLDQDVARMQAGLRGTLLYVAGIVGGLLLLSAFGLVWNTRRTQDSKKV